RMPQLLVARAEPIADDIHRFEFRAPDGGDLPPFSPGAHVLVTSPGGLVRKYSLCNDADERDRYVIAVKRDPGGRGGSVDLVDRVRVGDRLHVSEPGNAFELDESAPGYLLLAGGIGITPILSMARRLASRDARFRLYYCTRTPAQTPFA